MKLADKLRFVFTFILQSFHEKIGVEMKSLEINLPSPLITLHL